MRVPRSSSLMVAAIAAAVLFFSADAPALVARQDAKPGGVQGAPPI